MPKSSDMSRQHNIKLSKDNNIDNSDNITDAFAVSWYSKPR